jgi:hypothetical protein
MERGITMKAKKIAALVVIGTSICFLTSCAIFKKKEKEQVYDQGKEGQWVYSTQKPSPYGDQKRATSYSKRPYTGREGEDGALGQTETKPIITPYLLGRLKYKVVVVEFQDNTKKGGRGLGALVTQQLNKQVEESGAVVLVNMEAVKKSLGRRDPGFLSTPSALWKLRALLGAQSLVTGTIQDALVGTASREQGGEAMAVTKMEVTVFDTETGNIIRSIQGKNPIYASRAVGELSEDKALLKAIDFALEGVTDGIIRGLANLEWSTSVASVEGSKIYLNAGKSTGLKIGDVVEVYGLGRLMKHPVTSVSLGRLPGKLKGKAKVTEFLGIDASQAEIVSGGGIATGDIVRLSK